MFFVATFLVILVTLECHGEPNSRDNVTSWTQTTKPRTTVAGHVVNFPSVESASLSYQVQDRRPQAVAPRPVAPQAVSPPPRTVAPLPQESQVYSSNCNCNSNQGVGLTIQQQTTVTPPDVRIQNSNETAADSAADINKQLRQFGLNLLIEFSEIDKTSNLILSPFSIWTLLLVILEGARGTTAEQIRATLHLPRDADKIRSNYKFIENGVLNARGSADIASVSALFFDKNRPLYGEYQSTVERSYHAQTQHIDFTNPRKAVTIVNEWVANQTRNRITRLIHAGDLVRPELLITNAIYFKGLWETPFNSTATKKAQFFNEDNVHITNVDMMYQKGVYLYSFIREINSHVLDMPYEGHGFRMLVILPQQGNTLLNVYWAMKRFPVNECYKRLLEEQELYTDSEVPVYLPRFKVNNDRTLNQVLENLGIRKLFDAENADLTGMMSTKAHLNKMIHVAEIEVNEKGTTASGASGGLFGNKQSPPKFVANRPFAFFIVEDSRKTVIFAGRVLNPNKFD